MESLENYIKKIEIYITKENGDLSLVDEYRSHLEAEFQEFLFGSDQMNNTLSEIERKFVLTLEDPEIIGRSLLPESAIHSNDRRKNFFKITIWDKEILTWTEFSKYYFVYLCGIVGFNLLNFLHEFFFPSNFIVQNYGKDSYSYEYANSGYAIAITIFLSFILFLIFIPLQRGYATWKNQNNFHKEEKITLTIVKFTLFLIFSCLSFIAVIGLQSRTLAIAIVNHIHPESTLSLLFWSIALITPPLIFKVFYKIYSTLNRLNNVFPNNYFIILLIMALLLTIYSILVYNVYLDIFDNQWSNSPAGSLFPFPHKSGGSWLPVSSELSFLDSFIYYIFLRTGIILLIDLLCWGIISFMVWRHYFSNKKISLNKI